MSGELDELRDLVLEFRNARDWEQFHTLAHLVSGLQIEAAELAELLLWKRADELQELREDAEFRSAFADELADVLTFVLYLSEYMQVDLGAALRAKLAKNEQKYPVASARGQAKKYDRL